MLGTVANQEGYEMANEIVMQVGEGKQIKFTLTCTDDTFDFHSGEYLFGVKDDIDDANYLLVKSGESFDKTDATASGEISVNITSSETTAIGAGTYVCELKSIFTANTDVDKSDPIPFILKKAVTS